MSTPLLPTDERDYTPVLGFDGIFSFSSGLPGETPRRQCFNIRITDDELYENVESFTLILFLDTFDGIQSGILVEPNVTEIFVLSDDGNS